MRRKINWGDNLCYYFSFRGAISNRSNFKSVEGMIYVGHRYLKKTSEINEDQR